MKLFFALRIFAPVVFASLLPLAHAAPPTPAPDPVLVQARRDIDAGNADWTRAWETADAKLLTSLFAPDGVQFRPQGQTTAGRAALLARFQHVFQITGPARAVSVTTLETWRVGDLVYESGRYRYRFPVPHKPDETDTGHYVTVWQKQPSGHWKIHVDFGVPE